LRRYDQSNTRKASLVLANSYFSRESIYRIYGISAKVCYLGVDTEYFRPVKLPKENLVLSVGSVTAAKGNELVVEGLACIPKRVRPTLVLVYHVSNIEEKEYLEKLAADRGVTLVFIHQGDTGRLVELYNTASVTAFSPYLEPLGLVPLESMACGTPVVGVREAGVRETVVDGQTGILVDRSPEEFGNAVRTLIDDKKLATEYGSRGRDYVMKHWTWGQTVQRVEKYLIFAANGATGS
jgi:glycosyltransferase involved in cell wall biosynthesis